jgi:threonine dehydrogenase-like Zn-dependent dehydrogenase
MTTSISRRNILQAAGLASQVRVASAQRRTFRALVRYGTGAKSANSPRIQSSRAKSLICTQASGVCRTIVSGVLSNRNTTRASIPNHSGMGVVEEVGSLVKRVQPGDRVIVPGTPQCGQCCECIAGRPDCCQFLSTKPAHPIEGAHRSKVRCAR